MCFLFSSILSWENFIGFLVGSTGNQRGLLLLVLTSLQPTLLVVKMRQMLEHLQQNLLNLEVLMSSRINLG